MTVSRAISFRFSALFITIFTAAFLLNPVFWNSGAIANEAVKIYAWEGSFEDAKFSVQDGIVGKGLKVVYEGHISAMLERTSSAVGKPNPYLHGEYMLFCSAKHSNASVNADIQNIGICPYIIFLYETKKKPGIIHIGYRPPAGGKSTASKAALAAIDKLIDGIVREAAEIE